MSVEIDVELQGVVRKTINAIRLCEVNKASKVRISVSIRDYPLLFFAHFFFIQNRHAVGYIRHYYQK